MTGDVHLARLLRLHAAVDEEADRGDGDHADRRATASSNPASSARSRRSGRAARPRSDRWDRSWSGGIFMAAHHTANQRQIRERSRHMVPRHLLAPAEREVGVVERLGEARRALGRLGDELAIVERLADEQRSRRRCASCGREPAPVMTDARRLDDAAGGDARRAPPRRAPGSRTTRAAAACGTTRASAVLRRQVDRRQDLVRTLVQICDPVVAEQLGAPAMRRSPSTRDERDLGADGASEDRRRVRRRHRPAARRCPAPPSRPVAVALQAEVDRPCATRASGRSSCSACRGRGCRRACPCCAGAAWRSSARGAGRARATRRRARRRSRPR